jgi:hypothetical protein
LLRERAEPEARQDATSDNEQHHHRTTGHSRTPERQFPCRLQRFARNAVSERQETTQMLGGLNEDAVRASR